MEQLIDLVLQPVRMRITMAVAGRDSRYLFSASEPVSLLADGVTYGEFPVELSDMEFAAMGKALQAVILPYIQNKPAPERKRRIFATVVLPDRPATAPKSESASGTSGVQSDITGVEGYGRNPLAQSRSRVRRRSAS